MMQVMRPTMKNTECWQTKISFNEKLVADIQYSTVYVGLNLRDVCLNMADLEKIFYKPALVELKGTVQRDGFRRK